jgi:hypothetical protein
MAADMDKLNVFVGQFVGDLGAAVHAGMVVIGEKLGLYKALAEGPLNSAELAAKTRQMSVMYANGWAPKLPAATLRMTKKRASSV